MLGTASILQSRFPSLATSWLLGSKKATTADHVTTESTPWALDQFSSGLDGGWSDSRDSHCCSASHFGTKVNGQVVQSNEEQQWYSTISTGLAFLTNTFLTASAGLAYTQLLWYILRSKTFTLAGVDATFAVIRDPWSFLNRELWSKGLPLAMMAIIVW